MGKKEIFEDLTDQEKLEWYENNRNELKQQIQDLKDQLKQPDLLEGFSKEKQKIINDFINCSIDPDGKFLECSLEQLLERVNKQMGNKVAAIYNDDIIKFKNNIIFDQYLVNFIHSSGGVISDWETEKHTNNSLVIRGLGGGSQKAICHCWETGRTFYAIDTGYWGNGKVKTVHRVTKNALQYLGPIVERPIDRARSFGYRFKKFKPGSKILLVPPSNKVMTLFGQPAPEAWVEQTIQEIRKYTDRPVEVRLKPLRSERVADKSIQAALANDVHCLITYNSIAAVEALMEGKPAIVLGENAASVIAETDLSNIENPKKPSRDEMDAYMANLAYQQFTVAELKSGYAWETVNESG
jgi:hypothetical protein